jgi:hypothetical protein
LLLDQRRAHQASDGHGQSLQSISHASPNGSGERAPGGSPRVEESHSAVLPVFFASIPLASSMSVIYPKLTSIDYFSWPMFPIGQHLAMSG